MKIIILFFAAWLAAINVMAQFTVTLTTNQPVVQLTVTAPNVLNADSMPVTPLFSTRDFTVLNNVVYLNPLATNSTTAVFTNIISMPLLKLTPYTVTSATNATFGFGAGLLAADTNYLYISVATNIWRRISIPTNSW